MTIIQNTDNTDVNGVPESSILKGCAEVRSLRFCPWEDLERKDSDNSILTEVGLFPGQLSSSNSNYYFFQCAFKAFLIKVFLIKVFLIKVFLIKVFLIKVFLIKICLIKDCLQTSPLQLLSRL